MNKIFFDRNTVNIIVLSLLSFIEALQVLIIVVLIASFFPIPVPAFVQKLFPLSLYDVRLERESFFYHVWIAVALGLQAVLMFLNRRRLGEGDFARRFLPYICTMAGLCLIQIFAIFKIFLWGNPWWARDVLYAFIGLGLLVRVFWSEFGRLMSWLWAHLTARTIPRAWYFFMDAAGIFLLIVLIFAPDLSEVLARMFSYDRFYHFDSFIMSPGWAHHNGLVLNKDVTSEYSLIIPIVFDGLMKIAGGFSYAHAVAIMIGLSGMYYFLLYGLWRYWTGSFCLSFFALMVSLKLQFFHWGVIPLIWIYPSATPLRSLPDVFFLFFILRFTQDLNLRWLFAAAFVSGLGLVWTLDVGVYMYAALFIAAATAILQGGTKLVPKVIGLLLLPWCIALGVLSIFYGPLVGQGYFWHNTFEFASLFLQGWGALPITDGLKDKQFFAFCMGFIIPVIYLGTLLYSLGMFLFRQLRPHLFMAVICIYGLGLYHYFIHRSAVTSYYAVIIPFIFVLLFWIQALISLCQIHWQKVLKILLCVWALTALTTGYLFTYYPNALNLSGFNWPPEKKFYVENFDFSPDAVLIDALTEPQERVALISSFETKILMQANRGPFFYYFPLIGSEHMQGEKSGTTYLHTYARLEQTLKQMQDERPSHLFIQTRLYQEPHSHEGLKKLVEYVRMHYQYQAQGQYLTALKRTN